jgi:hypothetical protein
MRRVQWQPAKGSISQLKAPQFLCRYCTALISITVRYLKRLLMLKDAPKQCLFDRDVFTGFRHGGAVAPQYFAPVFGVEDEIEKIEVKQAPKVGSQVAYPIYNRAGCERSGQV